ncbi:hypothetical protein L2E82_30014 [Cichorium intybus]|uniref:Uncharacterized protein n=1 Tax=Cichorium intybus TaxID=13427 RepID=A0ACB9CZ81_CICIN|nr:hypothetical protein L2E82_30014 [Cichorium intybus]
MRRGLPKDNILLALLFGRLPLFLVDSPFTSRLTAVRTIIFSRHLSQPLHSWFVLCRRCLRFPCRLVGRGIMYGILTLKHK